MLAAGDEVPGSARAVRRRRRDIFARSECLETKGANASRHADIK